MPSSNAAEKTPLFRENELQYLKTFVNEDHNLSAPVLLVQGNKSVGKTFLVKYFLNTIATNKTIIRCDECVTKKLLLQRCLKNIRLDSGIDLQNYKQQFQNKGREESRFGALCDTFAGFLDVLEQFFTETNYVRRHVLVLDRFDQCMEKPDELFTSFSRMVERRALQNLTVIIITSGAVPNEIATLAVPVIYFKPYSEGQVVQILQSHQLCHFEGMEETGTFWAQYCKIVVDLYYSYTGCNLSLLMDICVKLWDKFTLPIREGRYTPQDFFQVYRDRRHLFTDDYVVDVPLENDDDESESSLANISDLPYHSKFILIASYLASFVDPRSDINSFSKLKSRRVKKPKTSLGQLRKGLQSKEDIDSRLLNAAFFDLERLLAIFRVIYRNESDSINTPTVDLANLYEDELERIMKEREKEQGSFSLNSNVELNSQIATLVSLGLLGRTSSADILSSKARWKCNISWTIVSSLADDVKFPIQNYLVE